MSSEPKRYQFHDFTLDHGRRRLDCAGREIGLRPKTYAVLEYLVTHRHRVVPKEELLDEIWHGLRIEPQGVFQSISELRSVFGRHDFIRTVRGTGYEWVAPTQISSRKQQARWRHPTGYRAVAAIATVTMLGVLFNFAVGIPVKPEHQSPVATTIQNNDRLLEQAQHHLESGELVAAEVLLANVLSRNPEHLQARLDLAYVHMAQGRDSSARQLAGQTYRESAGIGAQHLRMASAVLLSRGPQVDRITAEQLAREVITIADRLHAPEFAAAGHERLGELFLDQQQPGLAAIEWGKAIDFYSETCPSAKQRVTDKLTLLTQNG